MKLYKISAQLPTGGPVRTVVTGLSTREATDGAAITLVETGAYDIVIESYDDPPKPSFLETVEEAQAYANAHEGTAPPGWEWSGAGKLRRSTELLR